MKLIQKAVGKSITYRIGAILLTFILAFWLTGNEVGSLAFSVFIEIIHSVWYFFHELIWEGR